MAVINNPKHAARTIFVVTASVEDARYLMGKCPSITNLCVGGVRQAPGKKMVERQVYLDGRDMKGLEEIHAMGKDVYLQAVPTEKKLSYEDIVKEYNK